MGLLREFREFTVRGSAVDMGVGMVLGAAFSGFIDSLVTDLLLPPVGLLLAKMNFEDMFISLSGTMYPSLAAAKEAGEATINYGLFITAVVRFIIILFAVFVVVRQMNRWKKPHQNPVHSMTKKECPFCCMPIPSQAVICPNCASHQESKVKSDRGGTPRWRVK
ncbi:large conductance mechanosensitive channel protein MscL [Halobacillus yeomjeoni]|uniref:Large-conductance mechanosensitive channel n=1 Tax=Halobacillus yeomjeoni TaxID=311194 RepID=A0A931HYF3_9BACI|nr:large conductance mechanosensitive channel protein MscL [Halobacillus yeomjeoni]MBH0231670.1 large conductance mechanosensitive channel protein MscL [Halobacillus yeomjeoni]